MKHLLKIFLSVASLLCLFIQPMSAIDNTFNKDIPKRESRAVWITTLSGLDWPKTKATNEYTRSKQKEELCEMLDSLKKIRINTVLLQTRVRGTMIYPSAIEPWDNSLTGTTGISPGYDPLAFAIEECHKRGMELHAWIVTIPCFKTSAARYLGKQSVLKKYPSLCKRHRDMWYLDPGNPKTADYLTDICEEITRNYDIDGIHFDYIRYPEEARSFPDQATFRKYGKGKTKDEWRRENINRCVKQMYEAIKTLKPWVKVSSSPIGKYRDLTRYPSYGWNAYEAVYQDAQKWMKEGYHDMLFPMMYFQGNHFYPFAADWKEDSGNKPVVPGLGIYFLSPREKDWELEVIERELQFIRKEGIPGQAYFRAQFLLDDVKGLYQYLKTFYYPYLALTPACNSHDSEAPETPQNIRIHTSRYQAALTWSPSTDNVNGKDVKYNIYASRTYPVDVTKAVNLVQINYTDTVFEFNPMYVGLYGFHFAVTAIDRSGNESEAIQVHNQMNQGATTGKPGSLVCMDNGSTLVVPPCKGEFLMILDLTGRIIQMQPRQERLSIKSLQPGVYQLRTLEKKGFSRPVGTFMKQ